MNEEQQGIVRKPLVPGRKFIAVDLDGTLAFYDKHISRTHIGEPIPAMVQRVKEWLDKGDIVCIFTSRVVHGNPEIFAAIHAWCEEHIGERLFVTAIKQNYFSEIWDDKAFSVEKNTGKLIA